MIIDTGARRRLEVPGVFAGIAGISKGVVSFIPNRFGQRPERATFGVFDDTVPVWLKDVAATPDGRAYTARFEIIER